MTKSTTTTDGLRERRMAAVTTNVESVKAASQGARGMSETADAGTGMADMRAHCCLAALGPFAD